MNKPIQHTAKAQSSFRHAAESINKAFDEIRKAKACVEGNRRNRRPHDRAYLLELDRTLLRLRQLRNLVEGEESCVFLATNAWISANHGMVEEG
jgi:hypothetical protein